MKQSEVDEGIVGPGAQSIHVIHEGGTFRGFPFELGHSLKSAQFPCIDIFIPSYDPKHEIPLRFTDSGLSGLVSTTDFCRFDTSYRAFTDLVALKLGKSTHKVVEQSAYSRSGVNALCEASKFNAAIAEIFNKAHEFFKVTSQAVKLPNHKYVTWAKMLQGAFEFWAVFMNTADMFFEGLTFQHARSFERVKL